MEENWFKDWFNTTYYHQLYHERNLDEAADFINKIIDNLQPLRDASMLDVACGKGRHALQLANKGFDVTGIDLSTSSIQEAKKYEQSNLHFFEHDMRLPFWMNYFDYAFNIFTSFGYFKTKREDNKAIRNISHALKPGGILVMDYLNANYTESNITPLSKKEIDHVRYTITKWHDKSFFYKKIQIEDRIKNEKYDFTETVSKYRLNEFSSLFNANGLEIIKVFGSYKLDTFNDIESPRLIMFAQKNQ